MQEKPGDIDLGKKKKKTLNGKETAGGHGAQTNMNGQEKS